MSENNTKKVIIGTSSAEITEKKSRFIGFCKEVHSEEEASAFLEGIRKEHWNARHNCYAFSIGKNNELTRSSDDREPQGTAGRPILDVILNNNATNIIIVVTRYFGGILLGTGGLTRAYSKAAQEALNSASLSTLYSGKTISFSTDYNSIGKIQYIISNLNELSVAAIAGTDYGEQASFNVVAEDSVIAPLKEKLTEATSGNINFTKEEAVTFVLSDGIPVEYHI